MANNWAEFEVAAAVSDYFKMLSLELRGQRYNKSKHRRALIEQLRNRSEGSIERKHQNISAVLVEMGIPYIDGYKPLGNYQSTVLPKVISKFLANHPELQSDFQADSMRVPTVPLVTDFLAAWEDPPQTGQRRKNDIAEYRPLYNPMGVNYLEREAQNQCLGDAGEEFVLNFERARLIRAGQSSLADRIEQVSVTKGPGAGFDIRSFEESGKDRYIEAKTTKYGKNTPFYVTPNELQFSRDYAAQYYLYRVFRFRVEPRMFTLQGHLQEQCFLKPSQFVARPG